MMKDIRDRMQRLVGVMSRGAYEREEAIALSLLSSFAGESIFLLGLPGVGKSMIPEGSRVPSGTAPALSIL